MAKFTVFRNFVRSQFQIIEAVDEEQAIEKAQDNQAGFDDCINTDDEWEYKAQPHDGGNVANPE